MYKFFNNLILNNTSDDFSKGNLDGVVITDDPYASITLEKINNKYCSKGIYTSKEMRTSPFNRLVMSWNADTPEDTSINIEAQVLIEKEGIQLWSEWLSWGNWSLHEERFSMSTDASPDSLVSMDTDTLTVRASGGKAVGFKYRLILNTSDFNAAPSIKLVAVTFRDTDCINALYNSYTSEGISDLLAMNKELQVPRFSQMLRDPKIASIICSPTSITMILNYHGFNLIPEETAAGVYDSKYDGFGNWSFNTAFAGNLGFEAFSVFCTSIFDLKREISDGHPVAVSVKYKNDKNVDGNLPLIHGAPIDKTNGHLIVVCGFAVDNGKEYVIVNDPAASSDEAVRLKYLLEEFEAAWQTSGRLAYIIHP